MGSNPGLKAVRDAGFERAGQVKDECIVYGGKKGTANRIREKYMTWEMR